MTRAESFKLFIKHFSKEKLPITLSDENIHYFDSKNRALNQDLIRRFIQQGEKAEEIDELTEYIACNLVAKTKNFIAVVYWRAQPLSYDYILSTFNKNGLLISKRVIAGVRSDGVNVHRSVATINEDWEIDIVAGSQLEADEDYNPMNSRHTSLELLSNGEIVFSLQE